MNKISLLLVLTFSVFMLSAQITPKPKVAANAAASNKTTTATVSGSSQLGGIFSAPSGTSIILQNNAKNDLTLTAKKETGMTYSNNTFNFATPFTDGAKFKVTVKKAPAGQTCIIYAGGEGKM
jgi:hypothetical protein